jgi:hypothetical protein
MNDLLKNTEGPLLKLLPNASAKNNVSLRGGTTKQSVTFLPTPIRQTTSNTLSLNYFPNPLRQENMSLRGGTTKQSVTLLPMPSRKVDKEILNRVLNFIVFLSQVILQIASSYLLAMTRFLDGGVFGSSLTEGIRRSITDCFVVPSRNDTLFLN